jgi:hypothetical protein
MFYFIKLYFIWRKSQEALLKNLDLVNQGGTESSLTFDAVVLLNNRRTDSFRPSE